MGNSSDDRVALVTGAGQRIGAAIARELHRAGCRVLVHYRSSAAGAEQLVHELNALRPDSCTAVQADLCRPDEVRALAVKAAALASGLDLLVNNASGFYATPLGSVSDTGVVNSRSETATGPSAAPRRRPLPATPPP